MIIDKEFFLINGSCMDILRIISKRGSKEILLSLKERKELTYTEIESLISNPRTTSKRLNELCSLGVIKRNVLPDKYRSVSYSLTKKGEEIVKILLQLEEFKEESR